MRVTPTHFRLFQIFCGMRDEDSKRARYQERANMMACELKCQWQPQGDEPIKIEFCSTSVPVRLLVSSSTFQNTRYVMLRWEGGRLHVEWEFTEDFGSYVGGNDEYIVTLSGQSECELGARRIADGTKVWQTTTEGLLRFTASPLQLPGRTQVISYNEGIARSRNPDGSYDRILRGMLLDIEERSLSVLPLQPLEHNDLAPLRCLVLQGTPLRLAYLYGTQRGVFEVPSLHVEQWPEVFAEVVDACAAMDDSLYCIERLRGGDRRVTARDRNGERWHLTMDAVVALGDGSSAASHVARSDPLPSCISLGSGHKILVVTCRTGQLLGVEASSGRLLWSWSAPRKPVPGQTEVGRHAFLHGGNVVVSPLLDGCIYVHELASGMLLDAIEGATLADTGGEILPVEAPVFALSETEFLVQHEGLHVFQLKRDARNQ